MKYRGFEIKQAERAFKHGLMVKGMGVFRDGVYLTIAADAEMAKRLIDQRIQMRIWQDEETKEGANA